MAKPIAVMNLASRARLSVHGSQHRRLTEHAQVRVRASGWVKRMLYAQEFGQPALHIGFRTVR
jgi:hypothetical protein